MDPPTKPRESRQEASMKAMFKERELECNLFNNMNWGGLKGSKRLLK